ncbi:hypothetical protein 3S11_13 [uncultured Caudovirales phage]|uniref:Scaffold protein n=1 Tax=uncultured Caudovirales phage TaxID=2100421 RepID=A0A2H4J0Y0_9CAUD|nr:hypothetical protein [Pseudomonas luteola]ASN68634.1 hypothetical protein 3S11_13 [uncultured Caudovirales phage]
MLKYQLDSLEGLEASLVPLYVEKDGKYYLQIDGVPQAQPNEDVTGLKAKVEELLAEKKAEAKKRQEAEEAAKRAAEEHARKTGDVDALQKSWEEKYTKALTDKDQTVLSLQAQIQKLTVGATAASLAGELAVQGSSGVLERLIAPRLSMEIRDGKPTVVVLDSEGRPSAMTVAEYKAEITNDPALAPLIAGSRATGGGAGGSKSGGAAKAFNQMSLTERATLRRDNPAEYERLKAQSAQK